MPIIKSLVDTDLYKLTQQWAIIQKFPDLKVSYTFIDRNQTVYPKGFAEKVQEELLNMESLRLTSGEANFLRKLGFLPEFFIDFLSNYHFNSHEVIVSQDEIGRLNIAIVGYWYSVVFWEVPILAIISELYYRETNQVLDSVRLGRINHTDEEKVNTMIREGAYFSDFGTRRRYSYANQARIVKMFAEKKSPCFVGTSNVHLAHVNGIKAIGTMAHEWSMAHSAIYGYKSANKMMAENWTDVYKGNLGIALSDTYTTDVFLNTFDLYQAKLFDGVRQDSGDPIEFAKKIIAHYKKLYIDPKDKVIIFSDSLTIAKAIEIKKFCVGKIKSSFGIGTHLTNDVGFKPLNIVIKLTAVKFHDDWVPVVKLSDDKGKNTGVPDEVSLCKQILHIK